jgi:two-component system, chemotaxis family, response regulator Rcp1
MPITSPAFWQTPLLLVEDNPADVYLIRTAVAAQGLYIHLSVVPNGRDALAFLQKAGPYALEPSPALILLDLHLPKLTGTEVLAELRRLPAYQATPVIVFSVADKYVAEPRCLQLGATAYVAKPWDFESNYPPAKP